LVFWQITITHRLIFSKFDVKVKAIMSSRKVNYLDFFKTVGKSKRLARSGWVREEISDPESVAEHSFRVGVLAMVISDKLNSNLDKNKLIKMALLHDLAEVITGDAVIDRWDVIDLKKRDERESIEERGIKKIFDKINQGDEFVSIFHEMISRLTPEAKVFVQLDKIEMALQAFEYEQEQGKNLEEFFVTASLYIKEPFLKRIFDDILKARNQRKDNAK